MPTPIETQLNQMQAQLRVLVSRERPTIGFIEVKELLGVKSDSAAYVWLAHNRIKPVTKGRYPRLPVTDAINYPKRTPLKARVT